MADQTLALPPAIRRRLVPVPAAEADKGLVQAQRPQKAAARGPAEAGGKRPGHKRSLRPRSCPSRGTA